MPSAGSATVLSKVLRQASRLLDDDDLAKQAGISPRQTVSRLCRAGAEREGEGDGADGSF